MKCWRPSRIDVSLPRIRAISVKGEKGFKLRFDSLNAQEETQPSRGKLSLSMWHPMERKE